MKNIANWFIPHKDTHQKAHLISWHGMIIYILLFILLQVSFSIISYAKPGVLGIAGNIDQKKLIELTNEERSKIGLPPLTESSALDQAAQMKAQNMFSENYWAHFAPSGKTPWDFILGSGYKFTYAGENLAKNFYNTEDVVSAWMASQTHKDNLLNARYKDIGIAVVNGVLNGEETTLVVQMFGTGQASLAAATAKPTVTVSGQTHTVEKEEYQNAPTLIAQEQQTPVPQQPTLVASVQNPLSQQPLIDPYQTTKSVAIGLISLITFLLIIDLVVLRRRGVFRLSSHHLAHMALLGVAAATILRSHPGNIL